MSTPLLVPQRRFVRTVLALAAASLASVLACPKLAAAEEAAVSLTYRVGAALDHEQRVVRSRGVIVMEDVGRDESDAIPIWLYGDRLQKSPPSLTDTSYERLFPYGVSRGGYRHVRLHLAGCDAITPTDEPISSVRGRIVLVPVCKTAARPYTVEFEADLALPQRYGTLGHTSGATMLADPFYPLVLDRAAGTPLRGRHVVDFRTNRGLIASAVGVASSGALLIDQPGVSHAPVTILDGAHVHEEVFAGVRVTLVTTSPPSRAEPERTADGLELRDVWEVDTTGSLLSLVRRAVGLLRRLGFTGSASAADPTRTMASRLVLVEGPERERLAAELPGMVVTSDRAFRLLPLSRVQRFHELAILRRIFAALVAERVERSERLADRHWVSDLDAMLLVDLLVGLEEGGRDRAEDLLGFASFHPAVDQLLYAPKVAFKSAYFHDIEERDPDRDGADRAANSRPFGHLILEKLRDRVGPRLGGALSEHLLRGTPLKASVAKVHAESLDVFFRTWLGPTPRLAYRIASVTSEPSGSLLRHRVRVERLGDTSVAEPVVVELKDAAGAKARLVWDGPGSEGVVDWTSRAPLEDATVDPDGRLIQAPELARDHPRFDDELRHSWRPPILSTFAVSLSVTEKRPDAAIDFVLKRRYDVRQWFGVTAAAAARGVAGRLRYARGIGPMRDLNATLGAVVVGVSALRSDNGFGGSSAAVTEVDVGASVAWDTRLDGVSPQRGWGVGASISGGAARQDRSAARDAPTDASVHPSATLAVRGEAVHALHPKHVLAGAVGAGATVCPALAQQLQALSQRRVLRAYAADELIGCSTAYAILEYRLGLISGLYWNAAHLARFKGLQLVPFAAGGLLSSRSDALFDRFFGEVGGGLRALVDWGGVQPGLFAVDAGWPLSRRSNTYVDSNGLLQRRPPFGLYLSFDQAF